MYGAMPATATVAEPVLATTTHMDQKIQRNSATGNDMQHQGEPCRVGASPRVGWRRDKVQRRHFSEAGAGYNATYIFARDLHKQSSHTAELTSPTKTRTGRSIR